MGTWYMCVCTCIVYDNSMKKGYLVRVCTYCILYMIIVIIMVNNN